MEKGCWQAKTRAQKEGMYSSQECSVCGATETICLREEEAFCHLCEVV
jgi:hypothetical protein